MKAKGNVKVVIHLQNHVNMPTFDPVIPQVNSDFVSLVFDYECSPQTGLEEQLREVMEELSMTVSVQLIYLGSHCSNTF